MKRLLPLILVLLSVTTTNAALYQIKQSTTAIPLVFFLTDSADHITGKTSVASPTVTISKAGGSFSAPSGAVTEIGNGWYKVAGDATDNGTLGPLLLHATGTGCDPADAAYEVVAYDPQDVVRMGLTALPNVVSGSAGAVITAGTGTAQLSTSSGLVTPAANSITASVIASDAITAAKIADGAIDAATLASDTITAAKIASNAITSAKIATDAIGASQIATDAIGADELAADAIGASEIATDAIGSAEIASDAIGASELAADSIGASEIAASAITSSEFAASAGGIVADSVWDELRVDHTLSGSFGQGAASVQGNVTGSVASVTDKLGFRLSSTGVDDIWDEVQSGHSTAGTFGKYIDVASSTISTAGLTDASIADAVWDELTASHVGAGSFGAGVKLSANSITSSVIASDAITSAKIADGAIDAATLASDTITAAKIADGAIDAATLASDTITAAKIATDAIGASEIAADAIGASEIAADAIGSSEIAASGINEIVAPSGVIFSGTISTVNSQVSFVINGTDFSDPPLSGTMLGGQIICIFSDSFPNGPPSVRRIVNLDADSTDGILTIDSAPDFTLTTACTFKVYPSGTQLEAIRTKLPSKSYLTGTSNSDGDVQLDEASGTLASGAITATSIASNAITSAKIATDAIGASQIAADAIGASEIAADAIGASEIAASAITSSEFADGTITAAKIASDAITSAKIADGAIDAGALASDTITAAKIAADAIGASEIAANAIGSSEIAADAIGESEIATDAVYEINGVIGKGSIASVGGTAINVSNMGSFTSVKGCSLLVIDSNDLGLSEVRTIVADDGDGVLTVDRAFSGQINTGDAYIVLPGGGGSSGTAAEVADAVWDELAADHVGAGSFGAGVKLIDNGITAAKIATDAITSTKIAAGAIGASELATGALTSDEVSTSFLNTFFTVNSGSSYPAAVSGSVVKEASLGFDGVIDGAEISFSPGTLSAMASANWDLATSTHTTAGTFGAQAKTIMDSINTTVGTTGVSVADGAITAAKIASNAITSAKIATDAIGASQIATDAIGASEVASDAITVAKIADGAITAPKIASNAITSAKIATDAIGSAQIATDAIGSAQIAATGAAKVGAAAWDLTTTGHATSGTFGAQAKTLLDTAAGQINTVKTDWVDGGRLDLLLDATATQSSVSSMSTNVSSGLTILNKVNTAIELDGSDYRFTTNALEQGPSVASNLSAIADAVWDEPKSGHSTSNTFGAYLDTSVTAAGAGGASAIADAVWDEALSGHATAGTFGAGVKLSANSITSSVIATDAIGASQIAASAIGASEVADGAIDAATLASDTITAAKIADGAIGASEVADGAIDAATLAANTITSAKIATDAIGASQIAASAIGASEIADGTITAAKIASDAITSTKIADGAIDAATLASDTITAAKIADGAIDAATLASDTITAAKIASDAITAAKIADGAIDAATLASNTITSAKIATDAIGSAQLAAGAIGVSELSTAILGVGYSSSTDSLMALRDRMDISPPVGTAGGGTLSARLSDSTLSPKKRLEVIGGEQKTITFVTEAQGRFAAAEATDITIKIKDGKGTTITKTNADVTRVTEEADIQVCRITLTPAETSSLNAGNSVIELNFDGQKAQLTASLFIIKGL